MHPPLDGRPLSQLPVNDIRNAEMLSEFMNIHTISKRLLVGCVTALIYDILMTEDQSIQFACSLKSPSTVKVLFQVYRWMSAINFTLYFFLVEFLKPQLCGLLYTSEIVMSINLAIIELILLLRVWVLYERSRVVGAWLLALAVFGVLSIIIVRIQKPDAPIKCVLPPPPDFTICSMPRPDELFYQYAIISAVHVISLFLVIWESFRTWNASINPLVCKFVFDGVSYYVVVTTVFIASVVAMTDERIVLPFMVSQYALFALGSVITLTSRFLPRASQFVCLPSPVVGSCSALANTRTRLLWYILLNRYRRTHYRHSARLRPARQRNAKRANESREGYAAEV